MKKIITYMLTIILLSTLITAQGKPDTNVHTGDNGYEIEYPLVTSIQINQPFTFHFHLYNTTNGIPINNDTTGCYFDLYNHDGIALWEIETTTIGDETDQLIWQLTASKNNFTSIGEYAYIFSCNSTQLGGFVSANFYVTKDGYPHIPITATAIMIFLILGYIVTYGIFYRKNKLFGNICFMILGIAIMSWDSTIQLTNSIGLLLTLGAFGNTIFDIIAILKGQ